MIDNAWMIRLGLRARRANLIGKTRLQESSSRRGAFSAAMTQYEELMKAAAVMGPASKAIALFYATSQAGMAIAAAHKADPWSFSSHGLKLVGVKGDIADIPIAPDGDGKLGAFQIVSAATNSPPLRGPARFGALWSSLPDLQEIPLASETRDPRALEIIPHSTSGGLAISMVGLSSAGGRKQIAEHRAAVIIQENFPSVDMIEAAVVDLLSAYPRARGCRVDVTTYSEIRSGRWRVELAWPCQNRDQLPDSEEFFKEIAPIYRYNENYYLRPSVEGGDALPPSALMTWWMILYALSMYSRYRPREWVKTLDVDSSKNAALIEYALELSLEVIPHLVAEALDGEPLLLSKALEL